jgi:hypothetical protein
MTSGDSSTLLSFMDRIKESVREDRVLIPRDTQIERLSLVISLSREGGTGGPRVSSLYEILLVLWDASHQERIGPSIHERIIGTERSHGIVNDTCLSSRDEGSSLVSCQDVVKNLLTNSLFFENIIGN